MVYSFPMLLQEITTNPVAYGTTRLLSYSYGQISFTRPISPCRKGSLPLGGSRGEPFPGVLLQLEAAHSPWLVALSFIFKASRAAPFLFSSLCFCPHMFSLRLQSSSSSSSL